MAASTATSGDENVFDSDSSSNELLEKCPICLLTFREQEIGSPVTCDHVYCANCIEAWSRNVQTCPIDRKEFQEIIVRESYSNRRIVRRINVDPNQKSPENLDTISIDEDITNCEICHEPDREDVMLLCDECNRGYHMDCLSPPLSRIPVGVWYCMPCQLLLGSDDEEHLRESLQRELAILEEDIRQSGIPAGRLRIQRMEEPRILRTRQNERIRAAILRHSLTNRSEGRPSARQSSLNSSSNNTTVRRRRKRCSRRARTRAYIVEYDVNNFNEKFAVKTAKRLIRRRRKCRRNRSTASRDVHLTASQRLAEQLGVRNSGESRSFFDKPSSSTFSLFGNRNDLEYFSDSDSDTPNPEGTQADMNSGGGLQTSLRVTSYHHSPRIRKGVQRLNIGSTGNNADILSSILDMQDRWHNNSHSWDNVQVNSDGSLNLLKPTPTDNGRSNNKCPEKSSNLLQLVSSEPNESSQPQPQQVPLPENVTHAPMFSRGGGDQNNFQSNSRTESEGGGGNRNYSNQYTDSGSSNYCNSGRRENSSNYSSFGGERPALGQNLYGMGNQSLYGGVNMAPNNNPRHSFSPFPQRFNLRHPRMINNPRNMSPFGNRSNELMGNTPQPLAGNFRAMAPPNPLMGHRQQLGGAGGDALFAGLPPPVRGSVFPANPVMISVPPPPRPPTSILVPPPAPTPAPLISGTIQPFSLTGFNSMNLQGAVMGNTNCPNFSVYSHESRQVAKQEKNSTVNDDSSMIETEKSMVSNKV